MDLLEILKSAGGNKSLESMGRQLGIGGADTGRLVGALAPALLKGLQNQTRSAETLQGLERALASGRHQRYLDDPDQLSAPETKTDGDKILGHLFGSKDVSRSVANDAANSTGIDASLIRKALPILAGLAMGAMSKRAKTASGQLPSGGIGELLGSLAGTSTAGGLGDLLEKARKLF